MKWVACGLLAIAFSTIAIAQETLSPAERFLDRRVCGDVAAGFGLTELHHVSLLRGNHYSARVVTGDWQGVLLLRYAGRSGRDRCWTVQQGIEVEDDLSGLEALGTGHCGADGFSKVGAVPGVMALVQPIEDWASPPSCYTVVRAWYLAGPETEDGALIELRPDALCCGTPAGG